jgi:hypothetical protein
MKPICYIQQQQQLQQQRLPSQENGFLLFWQAAAVGCIPVWVHQCMHLCSGLMGASADNCPCVSADLC